ncbi:MAG: IPExxxVDY family protein [Flavobacteriaceae bacterium]
MALHKLLVDDFEDDAYLLLAIHSNLEDYRMAFLLNQFLSINLKRSLYNLDFIDTKASYSVYEWQDNKRQTLWYLIANIFKRGEQSTANSASLFSTTTKVTKTYNLIPEHKNVNYFLKIENDNYNNIKTILSKIKKIPQVVTVYDVDVSTLKSKNNLIFN